MRLAGTLYRVTGVAVAATATAVMTTLVGAAPAAADEITDVTLVIATPDIEYGRALCTTSVGISSQVTPGVSVTERARITVFSQGCGPVTWDVNPIIGDMRVSPLPFDGESTLGSGSGNPATALASQSVPYGYGIREASVITMRYWATSRLGDYCYMQRWEYDVVTNTAKPTPPVPCA